MRIALGFVLKVLNSLNGSYRLLNRFANLTVQLTVLAVHVVRDRVVTGLSTFVGVLNRTDIVGKISGRGAAVGALNIVTLVRSVAQIRITHLQLGYLTGYIYATGNDFLSSLLIGLVQAAGLTGVYQIVAIILAVTHRLTFAIGDHAFFPLVNLAARPAVLKQNSLLCEVLDNSEQINGLGMCQVRCMGLACTDGTTFLLYALKQQIFGCVEALQRIAQLVAYVRSAFFLQLSHLRCVVEQRVHRVEVQGPAVDVRVNVVSGCRTVQERLALLPMLAHSTPGCTGFRHQGAVIRACLIRFQDLLTFVQQHQPFVGHRAVSGYNGVFYVRLHRALQSGLFV